jgi:predicted dehydrogenase
MAPPIKVGIVGYGFSARTFHIPFILSIPDLAIHAFLQRGAAPSVRGQPGSSCTDDYPSAKRYDTAEGFFADKNTELVVVTTGVGSHAELAEKALRAGKHGEYECECKCVSTTGWSQLCEHLMTNGVDRHD